MPIAMPVPTEMEIAIVDKARDELEHSTKMNFKQDKQQLDDEEKAVDDKYEDDDEEEERLIDLSFVFEDDEDDEELEMALVRHEQESLVCLDETTDEPEEHVELPDPKRPSSPLAFSFIPTEHSGEGRIDALELPSSTHTYTLAYTPPRHQYTNHGHSRLKLLQLRWFWSTREHSWADSSSWEPIYSTPEMPDHIDTFSDVNSNEPSFLPPTSSTTPTSQDSSQQHRRRRQQPPSQPDTVHPRLGDLSALRDPYAFQADKCFKRLPLWTMSKTLWMFDLHVGKTLYNGAKCKLGSETSMPTKEDTKKGVGDQEDESEEEGAGTLRMSGSTCSNDSDATLVGADDDESWSVVSPSSISGFDQEEEDEEEEEEEEEEDEDEDEDEYAYVPLVWAADWYRRWELLIRLVRLNQERKQRLSA